MGFRDACFRTGRLALRGADFRVVAFLIRRLADGLEARFRLRAFVEALLLLCALFARTRFRPPNLDLPFALPRIRKRPVESGRVRLVGLRFLTTWCQRLHGFHEQCQQAWRENLVQLTASPSIRDTDRKDLPLCLALNNDLHHTRFVGCRY